MINHPNRSRRGKAVAATALAGGEYDTPSPRRFRKPRIPVHDHEREYPLFEKAVRDVFIQLGRDQQLFMTDAAGLYDAYLKYLPSHQQIHNCHACRRFIERYGGLAIVPFGGNEGYLIPACWSWADVPAFYRSAVTEMARIVANAKITGPFYTRVGVLGEPRTGEWTHLHAVAPNLYTDRAKEPHEATAAKVQDFQTVRRALGDFTAKRLDEIIRILDSDALSRSEKFLAPARWLRSLHDLPKGKAGTNLLWKAIAEAPAGFCHPRSGVLAPLLEAVSQRKSVPEIQRMWKAMLHPLQYQRPQAAPSAGNIAQAEKLVAKLGIERSLERRFARIDEVRKLWVPTPPKAYGMQAGGGVFGHLKRAQDLGVELPQQVMTWAKFSTVVLPHAREMEISVPSHGNFVGITTAVHADAPPILQWDREDHRYPVSGYVYHKGSSASQWGLVPGWRKVTAVVPPIGSGQMVVALIEGARDSRSNSLAIFPETLKTELHGIRATIEAHSASGKLSGYEDASACGLPMIGSTVRCFVSGGWAKYQIDRWD